MKANNKGKRKKQISKAYQKIKNHPHYQAICWIIIILVISGILSVLSYEQCPAISAILASICAGCVTGIAFYVISNLRNNGKQATNEEYKSIKEHILLAKKTINLGISVINKVIEGNLDYKSDICRMKDYTDDNILYMSTLFIDSPKATKLIKDFPEGYEEKIKALSLDFECLLSEHNDLDNKQILLHLCSIIKFCSETRSILLVPSIELMNDVNFLEQAIL